MVVGNRAEHNQIGLLLRDASWGVVRDNRLRENCVGLVVLDTSAPDHARHWRIKENGVNRNNEACAGHPDEGEPPLSGAGIALLGADRVNVLENRVAAHARDILFHTVPPNFGLSQIYIGGEYQGQVIEKHAGTFPASWWSALIPAAIATPDAVPVVREPRTFKIISPRAPNRPAGVVAWPSTLAQAGDIVVCIVDGERFRAFVPEPGHGVSGIADPAPGGTAVTVAVTNDRGVVTARCVAEV